MSTDYPTLTNTFNNDDYFDSKDIQNWLNDLEITIYGSNMNINGKCTLKLKNDKSNYSAEHIVFYCVLSKNNNFICDVIVKFYCMKEYIKGTKNIKNVYIKKFTQNHGNELLNNYIMLENYLNKFKIKNNHNIILNNIIIAETNFTTLWLEKYIDKFDRFVDTKEENWIVKTSIPILNELQLFIYFYTEEFHTIIDLQGGYDINRNIILTDIEYTNTMNKLGWDSNKLLNMFHNHNFDKIHNKKKNNKKQKNYKKFRTNKKI